MGSHVPGVEYQVHALKKTFEFLLKIAPPHNTGGECWVTLLSVWCSESQIFRVSGTLFRAGEESSRDPTLHACPKRRPPAFFHAVWPTICRKRLALARLEDDKFEIVTNYFCTLFITRHHLCAFRSDRSNFRQACVSRTQAQARRNSNQDLF